MTFPPPWRAGGGRGGEGAAGSSWEPPPCDPVPLHATLILHGVSNFGPETDTAMQPTAEVLSSVTPGAPAKGWGEPS